MTTFVKECPRCSIYKPLGDFARDPAMPDGLTKACNACRGTNDDEPAFEIQILTEISGAPFTKGYQFTRDAVENCDGAFIRAIFDAAFAEGKLSRRQYDLIVRFAHTMAEAFGDL